MKQGKVALKEIGKRYDLAFDSSDEWVQEALALAAPHPDLTGLSAKEWVAQSTCSGSLEINKMEPDYSLEGRLEATVPILCPRCGTEGKSARKAEFRLFLHPLAKNEDAEDGGDPDYIFLETPYVDLREILVEQIVAQEGVVDYPEFDSSGKKHECAAVIDELSSGQIEAKERSSPFAVLGKLKV